MKKYKNYILVILFFIIGGVIGYQFAPLKNKKSSHHLDNEKDKKEMWTCSMHPQIKKSEPGKCPICGMNLVKSNDMLNEDPFKLQMTQEAVKLANVQTMIIGEKTSTSNHNLQKIHGTIKADETKSSSLVTHIPGRIEKLYVSFTGEKVRKGQKIALIYSPELITAQKELKEAKKLVNLNPKLFEASKRKLKNWKISNKVINNMIESDKISQYFTIYADYSGVVETKRVNVGDYISTGAVLFDIQNLNTLWAVFDVYEQDLESIRVGDNINFKATALADKSFNVKINFIDPAVNPETRIVKVRGEIKNRLEFLKPEMFITGSLSNKSNPQNKIRIPKTAVLWTGKRSVVYIKIPDFKIPTYEYRNIQLGHSEGENYVILDGLSTGDEIVINGAFMIDAAAQLNNKYSMMNKYVNTKTDSDNFKLPNFKKSTPDNFKKQLIKVMDAYFSIRDALVNSNSEDASLKAKPFYSLIENVDSEMLTDESEKFWNKNLQLLKTHSMKIVNTNDLSNQRKAFSHISDILTIVLKAYGSTNNEMYFVLHCPMVYDNDGANWISFDNFVKNPYFGEKMLKCGYITDTIK